MWWLVLACRPAARPQDSPPESRVDSVDSRIDSPADSPKDSPGDSELPTPPASRVVWGDLHSHTNLSMDGCEDNSGVGCLPRTSLKPAEDWYARAREFGLDFAAMTDHSEFAVYEDVTSGQSLDIWSRTLEVLGAPAEGDPLGFAGYEWTAHCEAGQGIHRTVVLEEAAPCAAWRVPSCPLNEQKLEIGKERYYPDPERPRRDTTDELLEGLAAAASSEGCEDTRWVAFVHHPAYRTPADIDWSEPGPLLEEEQLVEVFSEHGSSECVDPTAEHCDWNLATTTYSPAGSLQAMLQAGHRPGLLAGTDSHDGRPGSIPDGPGPNSLYDDTDDDGIPDTARHHFTAGGLTGLIVDPELELTRAGVFDALESKRTVAASWNFESLSVWLLSSSGTWHAPGEALEPGTYRLFVELEDAELESWTWEWVQPDGGFTPEPAELGFAAGDVGYLRLRAQLRGQDQRVWVSPWWAD
jgi:hypothetical protein